LDYQKQDEEPDQLFTEETEETEESPVDDSFMFLSDEELKKENAELLKSIEEIEIARKTLPRKVDLKRILIFLYTCLNLWLLYVNLNSKVAAYIALYMIPLTVLLIDYSMMLGRMNRTIRGEP